MGSDLLIVLLSFGMLGPSTAAGGVPTIGNEAFPSAGKWGFSS